MSLSNKHVFFDLDRTLWDFDENSKVALLLIFQDLKSNWVKLAHKSSTHEVKLTITDFPHLGIWSKPGAPFVCIEPWQGMADYVSHNKDILQKKGILTLESNDEVTKSFTMEFNS